MIGKQKNVNKIIQDMNSILLEKDIKMTEYEHSIESKDSQIHTLNTKIINMKTGIKTKEDILNNYILFVRHIFGSAPNNIKEVVYHTIDTIENKQDRSLEPLYEIIDKYKVQ